MNESGSPKRQHGCLFFGCISGAVCLVLLLLGFLLAFHMIRNALTDPSPTKMPVVQLSQPEIEEVQRRFNSFSDATTAGRPTPPLELTSDEVNALIQSNPDFRAAQAKFYLAFTGSNLQAQVSLPTDQAGFSLFRGRYLNGMGTFGVSLENGLLRLTPVEFRVKGKLLPPVAASKIATLAAKNINDNSRASVALNRLQSIQVKDGKLIFTPKAEK